jgi:hypothetical protein
MAAGVMTRLFDVSELVALLVKAEQKVASLLESGYGRYHRPMPRSLMVIIGVAVLLLLTFANPLAGNVLGFCPISEGPKAIGVDVIAAGIDASAVWLIYRGLRS